MHQIFANGLIEGLLLAVIAISFSVVYSTTRVFYIALGSLYALAPYFFMVMHSYFPWPCSLGLTVLICGLLSALCEMIIHWPLACKKASSEVNFLASLGTFLVLTQFAAILWGNDTRMLKTSLDPVYNLGPVRLTQAQLLAGSSALAILIVLFCLLQKSNWGLLFRALVCNPSLLATYGRNIRSLRWTIFMLSGSLTALVSVLTASDVGFDPRTGMGIVLIGAVATLAGGMGSFFGAAAVGFLIGVVRSQVAWHTSARWQDTVTFIILAILLWLLPGGVGNLFYGQRRIEENQ